MTTVKMLKGRNGWMGFEVRGHTGWSTSGEDILCAAVSSAVQLVANGITECAKSEANVKTDSDTVRVKIKNDSGDKSVQVLLEAFLLHMTLLTQQYGDNICIEIVEV